VTHLRKMMLEELQASQLLCRNYTQLYPRWRRFFSTLPLFPGPLGSSAHSGISGRTVSKTQVVLGLGCGPSGSLKVLLHQDAKKGLERRRHSLSKEESSSAGDSQPGRSGTIDPGCWHFLPSHPAHDSLRHRRPELRADPPESQRHRQSAHGRAHPWRQGPQRSRCHAQCQRINPLKGRRFVRMNVRETSNLKVRKSYNSGSADGA
jgi:hypothetical protein